VLVRGGGAKWDLAAFDHEAVARAIVESPFPVWTGIGHTGDESVADIVANRAFVTPTECGHELVVRAEAWWQRSVAGPGAAIAENAQRRLEAADRHLSGCQGRLAGTARQQVGWHRERLAGRIRALARGAPAAIEGRAAALRSGAARIGPAALRGLGEAEARAGTWRRLLGAFDVERQLERGYTLTMDEDGRILRSGAALGDGDVLVTRFADATARSVVGGSRGEP
jgi:exodeoxyribonuclease VII large subunit